MCLATVLLLIHRNAQPLPYCCFAHASGSSQKLAALHAVQAFSDAIIWSLCSLLLQTQRQGAMKAVAAATTAATVESAYHSSAAKTPSSTVRSRIAEQHPVLTHSSSVSVAADAAQRSVGAYSSKQQPLHSAHVHNSSTNSSLNSSSSSTPAAAAVSSYSSTGNSSTQHASTLQRSPPAGSTDKLSLSFTKQDPTPLQSIAEVPSPGEQCGGESPDTGASLWPCTSVTAAGTAAGAAAASAAHNSSVLNTSACNSSSCSSSSHSSSGSTSSSSTGYLTAGGSAVRPCANSGGNAEAPSSAAPVAVAAAAAVHPTHRRAHSGHSPGFESGYGESPRGLHSAFSRLLSTGNVVEVNGIPYVRMDCIGRGGSSKVGNTAATTTHILFGVVL
jgi:hypothetical protein